MTNLEAIMKYLVSVLGLLVGLLLIVYTLAFTPLGNSLLQPTIEKKIQEQLKLDTKLESFSLSMSDFELFLRLSDSNTIHLKGDYSPFSESFDINYKIDFKDMTSLKPLLAKELRGEFKTNGKVKGDISYLTIDGESGVAKSTSTYHVELSDLNPTSIIAKVNNADLESILYMIGEKTYASAILDLDVNFKNIKAHELDGKISLKSKNGELNKKLLLSDFNITMPETSFAMNLDAKLNGDDVDYKYDLSSNIIKVLSSGVITPEPFKADAKYSFDIKSLELLKPIAGVDLRGVFNMDGTIKGTKKNLLVKAKTDVASSKTDIVLVLNDFKASSLMANIQDLKIQNLLYMLKQPHYTDGSLSVQADIDNLKEGSLKGSIKTEIKNGALDSKYFTKEFEFKSQMPKIVFALKALTNLESNTADTRLELDSTLAKLDVKSAKFDISESSLKSDYIVKVKDLDKLYFATQQHLKGSVAAEGEIKKVKDLDISLHTKLVGGIIDAKIHNEELKAELKNLHTLGLLRMLIYPQIFNATLDGKLSFDMKNSKGHMKASLSNGAFAKNQMFALIKQYTRLDVYKESFNGDIDTYINKNNLTNTINLASRKISIKTKDTKLNTKTQVVDAKLSIVANNNSFGAEVKGNINKPDVKLDAKELINKAVEKGIQKLFKKLF